MKIALLPGGFKPPHLGHYNMAKYLADFADKVIIRIGQKEREGIGKELALEIWNYYKEFDPDSRSGKLVISVAQSPSPVRDVYDFVEQTAPEGSTVILGLGEKDASDGRYNSIPKFAEPRNIKAEIELVPPQAGGISGTRMREIIKSNNKDEFFKFIPDYLPEEIKEEIWTKLLDTTMPQDVEEMMGGTMNKQEMDKHNANMKKLKKRLSKINSQGDMVPVPRNLTKGLRRKLYEKVGIQRGTVESEVQFLSREIFELFKENLGKKYHTGGFEGWLEGSEFIAEFEITDLTFTPRDAYKMNGEPYSIEADTDDEEIEIIIDYNPTVFPEEFNNFIAELKETLRHEIEHIVQFNFMPGAAEFIKNWKDGDSWIEYLTRPQEIPAFVKGLKKRAKTKKISLIDAIDEFIEEYIDNFEGPEEIEQVKQIWINWAKENLPAAQFENYPPYKANQVQQTRYKSSDTFTRDPKKSKKLGYLQEKKLSTKEKAVVDDILGELNNLQEIDLNKIKEKLKYYGRKGMLTLSIILAVAGGLQASPNISQDVISTGIEMVDPSSQTDFYNGLIGYIHTIKQKEFKTSGADIELIGALKELQMYYQDLRDNKTPLSLSKSAQAAQTAVFSEINKDTLQIGGVDIFNYVTIGQGITILNEGDPKKGTGKKPKGSGRRLYTDENPSDTVKVKFSTRQDIVDTLNKSSFKSKSHARQSQVINLIHQRVRAALNRAKDPDVKKRLRPAFEYIKKRKEASKKKTERLKKAKTNEMKLFSKEWWSDVIIEEIINEGGAAGHMAHPFDLPNVTTGKDLIKSFEVAADSLKNEPGAVKIDGVNASIRLLNNEGKREFAMDRGSKKALDLRGVTKADLEDRFGPGHGMIKAGGNVLDIFNAALPSTEEELNALGLLNDPNVMFNMEYVSGKSNVQDYGKNFLAIHGLLSIESKEVQGARKMLTKRITTEKNFDQADMDEYLKKLEPFAKKRGFEIFGSVPTTFTKEPDFKAALGTNYTIDFAEGDKTKSLVQWLNDVSNIPKTDRLKMNVNGTVKDVGALSKQVYFAVFGGENVDDLFDNEQDIQKAVQGATTYLATEKLGDAILDVLDSPMGSVNDHEGVVIRDPKVSPKPYKITGKFITGGVSSNFQKK